MKTFTYPQKKWVMTGALLAVLGFNVSFNSHNNDGIATADFASTVAEGVVQGKIYTAKGVVPVKYIDNGEDKVLAIVPKKMTEGKVCDTCGYDSIPLSVKNKEDIDALNVELMKAMEKQIKTKTEVAEASATVEGKEGEEPVKKNPFDSIAKSCKRISDKTESLNCYKDKYLAILKDDKKSKDVDSSEAMQFYKNEIQSRILSQISEARRVAAQNRRSAMGLDQLRRVEQNIDILNPEQTVLDATFVIEDLVREVPSKFESVRRSVLAAQTEILKYEASIYKDAQNRALTTKNTQEFPYLKAESDGLRSEYYFIKDTLNSRTQFALQEAYSNQNITYDLQQQYNKFITDFNQSLEDALSGKGTLLNGAPTAPQIDFGNRLTNPGRGAGVNTGTLGAPAISSRTGANLNATGTQTILVPVQVQNGVAAPQVVIPTQNNGVSFGTMGPASADSLRMRMEIQSRFPRQ